MADQDPAARFRTPLLTRLTEEALEQDYQMVAQRGGGRSDGPGGPFGKVAVIAVVAAFGLLVALAAVQTSRNADVEDASRATLIDRIETRSDRVADIHQQVADLRDDVAARESDLVDLVDDYNAVDAERTALEVVTGFTAVTGPGIRIELDNALNADPDTEHIRDSDLALLVDGLWSAGAEAISINGQRLNVRGAIRNSGTAIEVNSTGIAPPYTVLAIGDPDTLLATLAESASGRAFLTLADQYGFAYESDIVDELRLPSAPAHLRQLRSAEQATSERPPEGEGTP